MIATLRSYWPQISAAIEVAAPLLIGIILVALTRQGALTGWWRWTPLLALLPARPLFALFPLFGLPAEPLPGSGASAVPLVCWLLAALTLRSGYRGLHAASLLATGASTAVLQLWHLSR